MDTYKIIKYPNNTEKAIRLMESENKLLFTVDVSSTKVQIKKAIEEAFNAKVGNVNTYIDRNGEKKAYVQFKEPSASEIATKLGMI